jgi:hypothetical protein
MIGTHAQTHVFVSQMLPDLMCNEFDFEELSGREPTRATALLGRVYVRQRGRSTSKPALALRVGLEPGLTRAAEERGPLPPVSEFCRSRSFLRI